MDRPGSVPVFSLLSAGTLAGLFVLHPLGMSFPGGSTPFPTNLLAAFERSVGKGKLPMAAAFAVAGAGLALVAWVLGRRVARRPPGRFPATSARAPGRMDAGKLEKLYDFPALKVQRRLLRASSPSRGAWGLLENRARLLETRRGRRALVVKPPPAIRTSRSGNGMRGRGDRMLHSRPAGSRPHAPRRLWSAHQATVLSPLPGPAGAWGGFQETGSGRPLPCVRCGRVFAPAGTRAGRCDPGHGTEPATVMCPWCRSALVETLLDRLSRWGAGRPRTPSSRRGARGRRSRPERRLAREPGKERCL